jgi:hypothetical protein
LKRLLQRRHGLADLPDKPLRHCFAVFGKSDHLSFRKNLQSDFGTGAKISLTAIPAPRILEFRDALSPKAIAVFYFSARPQA